MNSKFSFRHLSLDCELIKYLQGFDQFDPCKQYHLRKLGYCKDLKAWRRHFSTAFIDSAINNSAVGQRQTKMSAEEQFRSQSVVDQKIPFYVKILSIIPFHSLLQRFPGIVSLLFIPFCLLGPFYSLYFYIVYYCWLHFVFVFGTFR